LPWTPSGATLTPTDATKTVTVPGSATSGEVLIAGTQTAKLRLIAHTSAATGYLMMNRNLTTADDASRPTWHITLDANGDQFRVGRSAAGAAVSTANDILNINNGADLTLLPQVPGYGSSCNIMGYMGSNAWSGVFRSKTARGTVAAPTSSLNGDGILQLEGNGYYTGNFYVGAMTVFKAAENWTATARGTTAITYVTNLGATTANNYMQLNSDGSFYINGPIGQKSTGTTWANPSDTRLKKNITQYTRGLSEILQLEPISYTFKQNDIDTCGFDAEAVRAVFPECVGTTKLKLDPEDEEETEVLTLDIHPILIALVNAVKELASGRS